MEVNLIEKENGSRVNYISAPARCIILLRTPFYTVWTLKCTSNMMQLYGYELNAALIDSIHRNSLHILGN